MLQFNDTSCCGVDDIDGLGSRQDPSDAIMDVCRVYVDEYSDDQRQWPAFFMFTSIGIYGWKFASYIKKNGLGVVRKSVSRINPNSGSKLRVWMWAVNRSAMRKWYRHNK